MDLFQIAQHLIQIPSVTPEGSAVLDWIEAYCAPFRPRAHRLQFPNTTDADRVDNLFLSVGDGAPHFCFVGHVDVVPPGPLSAWEHPPFGAIIKDGRLYGRGARDMKGAIAAFLFALSRFHTKNPLPRGTVSLLLTSDEEGVATYGTKLVMPWLRDQGMLPDLCLVGEPTSHAHVGDQIKIGRRGSLTLSLTLYGKAGHVAYPHLAHNPLPALGRIMDALSQDILDTGTVVFDPSHLEISSLHCPNNTTNVIPGEASIIFNIRFNTLHTRASLEARLQERIASLLPPPLTFDLSCISCADPYLSPEDSDAVRFVKEIIKTLTKVSPAVSTSGGTSDARFIAPYCAVVECGALHQTIHQPNEHIALSELSMLAEIYFLLIQSYLCNNRNKAGSP